MIALNDLVGKTLSSIENTGNTLTLNCDDGKVFRMYHSQDCCENVAIEDIVGNLDDLLGTPIVRAEENSSNQAPEGYKYKYEPESATWTFYRIGTTKGTVVIRWLGTSNGYYSESVNFEEVK